MQCQCGMPSHRSETVRSRPRGAQAEGHCDCGSVAYSSCMLPLKGLQDCVAVKGSSRELVGGARGFFALAWGVTLSHHFDRVDRCSADQRMSDVRPAWSKVNSAIRCFEVALFDSPRDQITARYSLGCDCRSCLASTFRPAGVSLFSASSFSSSCSAS